MPYAKCTACGTLHYYINRKGFSLKYCLCLKSGCGGVVLRFVRHEDTSETQRLEAMRDYNLDAYQRRKDYA